MPSPERKHVRAWSCQITERRLRSAEMKTHTYRLFGVGFETVEAIARDTAEEQSPDYIESAWDFFTLANGGFYMAPPGSKSLRVFCANDFEASLSAAAFGVLVCQKAYALLSHYPGRHLAKRCSMQLRLLRGYARTLPEAKKIRAALA